MYHKADTVINQFGRPVGGATVTVYLTGTLTPAVLYIDNGITLNPGGNVVTADSTGYFFFWVAAGIYDFSITGPLVTTPVVYYGEEIGPGNGVPVQTVSASTGSIGAGLDALVTLTWGQAFADTTYKLATVVQDTAGALGLRVIHVESKTTTQVTVRVVNDDPDNAHSGTVTALGAA